MFAKNLEPPSFFFVKVQARNFALLIENNGHTPANLVIVRNTSPRLRLKCPAWDTNSAQLFRLLGLPAW